MFNGLHIFLIAVHILSTGYLPINLIPQFQLNETLTQVMGAVLKTNTDYALVINRLWNDYDMKLATFDREDNIDLIVQFPVFVFNPTATPHLHCIK